MPDVPPFGNPFVFAFAYRCSQIRLRIHPFRTAVGRREQQPSCQTVMAETSSASLSPEVPRSLSDRTRIVAIGIWNFSKTNTYHPTPPLFQSPAIQTGLARSPAKAGKGKLQTRHGRKRTDRQSCATARKTGDRRGVKLYYIVAFSNTAVNNGRGLSAVAERPLPIPGTAHVNSSTPWPPSDRRYRNRPEHLRSRRRSGTRSCPPSPAASGRHSSTRRRPAPSPRQRA